MLKSVQVSSGRPDSECKSLSLITFAEFHLAMAFKEGRKEEEAAVLTLAGADASRTCDV